MEFMHPRKHQYSIRITNGSGGTFHAKSQNVQEIMEFHEITGFSWEFMNFHENDGILMKFVFWREKSLPESLIFDKEY